MPIYVYEVIGEEGTVRDRFEVVQKMTDQPLTHHPDTGQPVRRVFLPTWIAGATSPMRTERRWPTTRNWSEWGSPSTSRPGRATKRSWAAVPISRRRREQETPSDQKPGFYEKPGFNHFYRGPCLQCRPARLASPDSNRIIQVVDKNLSVSDAACLGRPDDGLDDLVDVLGIDRYLDFQLRNEVDRVFRPR